MTARARAGADVGEVLGRLDAMFPLLQGEAADSERLRRPTPAVQSALRESGIFGLMVPGALGGLEATPLQVMTVIEKLSHADASLGWLVRALTIETANAAVYLDDSAVAELFDTERTTLIAGHSAGHSGTAVRVDGGYRVSGTWRFAPGVSMATHINLGVTVEGTGEPLVCVVPRSMLRIIDNWDMLGLRATASLDYAADDVHVPDDRVFRVGRDRIRRGGIVNRLSPALMAGLFQASWSQGVGRRMLDELRDLTRRRSDSADFHDSPVTSDEFFAEYARHYSHVRGTMALLRETWQDHEDTLLRGADLTTEQETMTRLASGLATRTALEISQLVHRFAGAQVMRNSALQRFFRDSHAGTQHRGSAHMVTQQCGRILSGVLPEGTHWGFFDLVIPEGNPR
ncbi:acyl-CoA dehydrogenase family protein [Gordonia sp. zg691]|uniref:Acyl-CoA dehydrogenase family protein n=2 Tax=Gordonia jinghuaiqii TaxID=2758710 RepID=A0A7D7R5M5_9ACTN|nr:acyl-CoA dehydrogenase family protein [Gordonia jinghuaiqii]MCR5978472.1 acyl-CoA dehydrogenase [Gordonia jinghuaiqii]QMT03767.1 acyl-CoA dehydrogenase family protein [Gordonia jinghuaiqii]